MSFNTSYATILKESCPNVQKQLVKLIRSGNATELHQFLADRKYARDLLDIIWKDLSTKDDLSLLMVAVLAGYEPVVQVILSHSSLPTKTVELRGKIHHIDGNIIDNVTALWCALDRSHFTIAHILINEGNANLDHGPSHSILIDAIMRERLDIVCFLIDNNYVDINQNGFSSLTDSNTALSAAILAGNLKLVQLFYKPGASLTVKNHDDKTPLLIAAENERLDILDYLLENQHEDFILNDLEADIASHIIKYQSTIHYKSEWIKRLLKYVIVKRIQFDQAKLFTATNGLYNDQQECRTLDEFVRIENDDNRLYIEALLIQERIFSVNKDQRLINWLFDRASSFVQDKHFDRCLFLVQHIFHLCELGSCQPSLEKYFWIFYNMFRSEEPLIKSKFWKTFDFIFKISTVHDNDNDQRDLSYLINIGLKIDFPDVSTFLHLLNLNDSDVANIYHHGSWIQGTCTPKSDRDLIIVTHTEQDSLVFWEDFDYFHEFELHKLFNKYDVCIYSLKNFERLLEKNYLLCVQCLFLPDQYKLKEEVDFRPIYLSKYYDPKRIKQVAFYEIYSSIRMMNLPNRSSQSTSSSKDNDEEETRRNFLFKNLFHGLRFLDLAEQLIQTQSIYDLVRTSNILDLMNNIRGDSTDTLALDRVLDFVRIKSTEMKSRLDALVPRDSIRGEFKVYIIFEYRLGLRKISKKLEAKQSSIKYQLASVRSHNHDCRQYIAIGSYHGEYPSMMVQLKKQVYSDFAHYHVVRTTITSIASNEGMPITDIDKNLFWDDSNNCFELNYPISWKQVYAKRNILQNKIEAFISTYSTKTIRQKHPQNILKVCLFGIDQKTVWMINKQLQRIFQRRLNLLSTIEPEFIVYKTDHSSMAKV